MQRLPIDISPKMDLYFRRFFTAWLIEHLDDGINISRSESEGKLCMSQVEDRYRNFIVEKIFSIKISFYTQSGILKKYFISFIFTNTFTTHICSNFLYFSDWRWFTYEAFLLLFSFEFSSSWCGFWKHNRLFEFPPHRKNLSHWSKQDVPSLKLAQQLDTDHWAKLKGKVR